MTLALRQAQLFECAVCKQHVDDAERQETEVRAKLFGARAYAVCPACGQEAPDFKTRALGAYTRRADRWLRRLHAGKQNEEVKRLWGIAESWHQEWKLRVLERDRQEEAIRRARARWRKALDEYRAARREAAP